MEKKYRIKEYDGQFTIEVYAYKTKGFLWWKKKVWDWYPADIWGNAWYPGSSYDWSLCPKFTTLYNANYEIKRWKQGVTYHEPS